MHAADAVDPGKTARALVAAKGNYRIDHRNVVQVLDLNCEANGLVWMRTELLKGYTLHDLLARQGRLSLPFALAVAIEAAFGLHAVHEAQIIHRDVKPSNLFYTAGRSVKVLDLSLAKVFPEGLETTVGGRRLGLGTPAYSAPEQLEGLVRPDVRFDVYGLGITLWEMLAGKNPFADVLDDMTELIKRQLTVMPPLLANVANLPPRVDDVLRRALTKDPAQRYSSMMEMARALMDLQAWVATEARARRLAISVPLGEPQLPGDANTWRDYRASEAHPSARGPRLSARGAGDRGRCDASGSPLPGRAGGRDRAPGRLAEMQTWLQPCPWSRLAVSKERCRSTTLLSMPAPFGPSAARTSCLPSPDGPSPACPRVRESPRLARTSLRSRRPRLRHHVPRRRPLGRRRRPPSPRPRSRACRPLAARRGPPSSRRSSQHPSSASR